jgi:uncharacterized protein YraI
MKLKTLAVALLSAAAAVSLSISTAVAQVAEVRTDLLNVRSGPGTGFAVRGTLPRGTQARVLQVEGSWLYIVTGPVEGWVFAAYVELYENQQIPGGPSAPSPETTVLVCNGTNRTTARVYRRDNDLMLRVHDRLDNITWMDTPARMETGGGATTYSNIRGETTLRVMQNQSSPSRCSIQGTNLPLEPGTATGLQP